MIETRADPIGDAQKALIKAIWACIVDASSMQVVMSGKQVNDAIRAFRAAIEAEAGLAALRHLFDDEALPDLRPPFEVIDGRLWGDDGDEVDAHAAAKVLNFVAKSLGFGSRSAGSPKPPD